MKHPTQAVYWLTALAVLLIGCRLPAEPLYPLRNQASVDNLHALLRQCKPDTNRVYVLLQLSEHYLTAYQEGLQPDLAKSRFFLREAQSLSDSLGFVKGKARSLCAGGRLLFEGGNTAGARAMARKAIALSKHSGHKQLEADRWYYLGETYARTAEELPDKIKCYQRALAIYREIKGREQEAYLLKTIADMHLWQGKAAQSINELLQVVALYRSIGYRNLHYTYDLLGSAHRNMGNYKEALKYALATLQSARATGDTTAISYFHWRLGITYLDLKQLEASTAYFKEALWRSQRAKQTFSVLKTTGYICRNMIAQQQPEQAMLFFRKIVKEYPPAEDLSRATVAEIMGDCYLALKQYAKAEKHYLQMLTIGKRDDQADVYQTIGNFYLTIGQYDKARVYLNQAIRMAPQVGSFSLKTAKLHLLLFKVDSAQANYPAAIGHYLHYKALHDSVFNYVKSEQIASLQIQHDTKQKEQNIALLLEQSKVQQARIRQRELQRNVIIAGAVVLLLLSGVIYNQYLVKQRSNQQLQAQQKEISRQNHSLQQLLEEKEWLLKEVHHRVKNNLHTIMSLLESQSAYLKNDALQAVRDSQHRVFAMSLLHQKLYQGSNVASIDMSVYLPELVQYLRDSFNTRQRVLFQVQIERVELDVTQAIPLGLILNEAITNALKYAFPGDREGIIGLSLTRQAENQFLLSVADNGVGLPVGFDRMRTGSLGMKLMEGLSREIQAQLHIQSKAGTFITVAFTGIQVLHPLQQSSVSLKMAPAV